MKNKKKIHLITNCTKNKRQVFSASSVMLSEIDEKTTFFRVRKWLKLTEDCKEKIPALNLYAGEHWSIAREEYKKDRLVWVLSAGWGLVNVETPISPYDATFNKGDINSIFNQQKKASFIEQNREWWNALHENRNLSLSIDKIFNGFSGDCFFLAIPPDYLKVIEPELIKLKESGIITTKNTFVITSGKGINEKLKELQFLVSEDFCRTLGGSRISLNIRLARYLMDGCECSNDTRAFVENKYLSLCISAQPAEKYNRKKLCDEDVVFLIKRMIEFENINSASVGLKELRKRGMACEQKRFGKLFNKIKEEIRVL